MIIKRDRLDQSIKVPGTGDAFDKLDASCFHFDVVFLATLA